MIERLDAHSGDNAFPAYMAELLLEITKEIDIRFVAGSEVAMTAFGGEGMIVSSIPIQASFSKTRARSNDGNISLCAGFSRGDHRQFIFFQTGKSICGGLEVIDKADGDIQFLTHGCTIELPGDIGQAALSMEHG